jgi:hypothetical protein
LGGIKKMLKTLETLVGISLLRAGSIWKYIIPRKKFYAKEQLEFINKNKEPEICFSENYFQEDNTSLKWLFNSSQQRLYRTVFLQIESATAPIIYNMYIFKVLSIGLRI